MWGDKLGIGPVEEFDETSGQGESMYWGTTLEAVLVAEFARRHPDLRVWVDKHMYRHPDPLLEFMLANLDARIGDDGLLECKTADKDLADEWVDGPPDHYQLQVMHYLEVMGLAYCIVVVLIGGNRFREYRIDRDDELISTMIRIERRFWHENVLPKVRPAAVGTAAEQAWLAGAYPGKAGAVALLPPESVDAWRTLLDVKARGAELEDQRRLLENQIKLVMGDATEGLDPISGDTLVTWRPQDRTDFDKHAFKEQFPRTFKRMQSTSSHRVFLPKTPTKKKRFASTTKRKK